MSIDSVITMGLSIFKVSAVIAARIERQPDSYNLVVYLAAGHKFVALSSTDKNEIQEALDTILEEIEKFIKLNYKFEASRS